MAADSGRAAGEEPLRGCRVIVARPAERAAPLLNRLKALGAEPIHWPAVRIADPVDWAAVDAAIARLGEYDWLVFTSANGVEMFLNRGAAAFANFRGRTAVVGPATAAALLRYGRAADLIPDHFRADALAVALAAEARGARVLVVRTDRGRRVIEDELRACSHCESVVAYRQFDAPLPPDVVAQISAGVVDAIMVSSPNVGRVLATSLDPESIVQISSGRTAVVAISPLTAQACRDAGLEVSAVADEATDEGMIEALLQSRSRSAFQPR